MKNNGLVSVSKNCQIAIAVIFLNHLDNISFDSFDSYRCSSSTLNCEFKLMCAVAQIRSIRYFKIKREKNQIFCAGL